MEANTRGHSGPLCRWIGVVIGVIGNFLSWVGILVQCAPVHPSVCPSFFGKKSDSDHETLHAYAGFYRGKRSHSVSAAFLVPKITVNLTFILILVLVLVIYLVVVVLVFFLIVVAS